MDTQQPRTAKVAVVLRPEEHRCEVTFGRGTALVAYGPPFSRRAETLAPGHLVAVTNGPAGEALVIWRWYDAVVLGQTGEEVRLWEPSHGEVLARPRHAQREYVVGTRAYASAGLPGADWWVEGPVTAVQDVDVSMADVYAFYDAHDLWSQLP